MKIDKSRAISNRISELAKRFGLQFILLFGSKAEGTDSLDSNTDIAVYGDHILSEEEKISLVYELTEIFQTEKVDIVDIKTAPPLLKKRIFDNF